MAKTKTEDYSVEDEIAKSEKLAEALVPQSAGVMLDKARKADTRSDADAQTNQTADPTRINIVKQIEDSQKEPEEKKEIKPLSDAEYDRRTKLDVSNPDYINSDLDHYKPSTK